MRGADLQQPEAAPQHTHRHQEAVPEPQKSKYLADKKLFSCFSGLNPIPAAAQILLGLAAWLISFGKPSKKSLTFVKPPLDPPHGEE